ncbi:nuclear transport factor 2 family protein [Nocardia vaccinii]|uniref:nuclear transport factor 2 family protein n=1 Tax=Nocardia vaccinii TaxID=1822 RepID=UPI000A00A54B|nr:nuclear transport factor 2 family protein [Nocardia vaccinii]
MPLSLRRRVAIVTGYLDRLGALDIEGAGRYLADTAVMIFPFALPGAEIPPLQGKSAILDQLRGTITAAFERMNFTVDECHDVAGSDALIAEYHSVCPLRNGGEYRNSYVGVFRFEGEEIVLHKEYFNPVRLNALRPSGRGEVQ